MSEQCELLTDPGIENVDVRLVKLQTHSLESFEFLFGVESDSPPRGLVWGEMNFKLYRKSFFEFLLVLKRDGTAPMALGIAGVLRGMITINER